ncbi:MAG: hypothetical protein KBT04_07760 [Bacteroidales bacterium]|nr:hypothetical protein [Candidatus Colimorpha onthohippi]
MSYEGATAAAMVERLVASRWALCRTAARGEVYDVRACVWLRGGQRLWFGCCSPWAV